MNTFGDRLRGLREDKKLSQNDLSKVFDLTGSTISQYESNKRKPDSDILIKLADYFQVSIDFLLGRENKQNTLHTETLLLTKNGSGGHNLLDITHDDQLQELIEKYYKCSPRLRKSILSFADQMLLIDSEQAAAREEKTS